MASVQKQGAISTMCHKNYNYIVEEYDNVFDVVKDCSIRPITNSNFEDMHEDSDGYGGKDSFNGVKDYQEALDLLKNGYIDQVETIKKELSKSVHGQNKRIKFNNDIVGYAPIVPLAILGVPNSMINSTMTPIKTKVLNVVYDITCSCNTRSKDIIRVGIEALKVLASMEMQGYRINLTAVQTYTTRDFANILKIKLKSANQPLDLKRVSFPMMHTAFFRVIGFDWYSKTPHGRYIYGYGHNIKQEFDNKNKQEFKEIKNKLFGDNVVYLAGKDLLKINADKVQKTIKEIIENECKSNNT